MSVAKAYAERAGLQVLEGSLGTKYSFMATDGLEKVAVHVVTVTNATSAASALDKSVPSSLVKAAKRAGCDRVDVVSILVVAPGKALLRHTRAVQPL